MLFSTTRPERCSRGRGGTDSKRESYRNRRLATISEFAAAARLAGTEMIGTSMIEDLGALKRDIDIEATLAIVGAGPAGIVIALEAARHGISCCPAGERGSILQPGRARLSEAAEWDRQSARPALPVHAPTSWWYLQHMGRPLRAFRPDRLRCHVRTWVYPHGLSAYEDVQSYFQRACDWMVCGRAAFNVSSFPHLPSASCLVSSMTASCGSSLERWSLPTNFGHVYGERWSSRPTIRLLTGVTCTEIVCPRESGKRRHLECRTNVGGGRVRVKAKAFVVACGGLEEHTLAHVLDRARRGAAGQPGRSSRPLVHGSCRRVDR